MSIQDTPRPTDDPPAAGGEYLAGSLSYWVRTAGIRLFSKLRDFYGEGGLTGISFAALTIISQRPGINQVSIARALGVETPRAVLIINTLESNGLATRRPSLRDRRNHELHVTRLGATKIKKWMREVRSYEETVLQGFSKEERKVIFRILWKLAAL